MAVVDFGGVKEEVVMRREFPMSKARRVLKNETIAVVGYGVQGPGQALNMKDNGFNVIIGQSRKFRRWRAWLSPSDWACIGTPSSCPSGKIWKPPRSRNIVASVPWKWMP